MQRDPVDPLACQPINPHSRNSQSTDTQESTPVAIGSNVTIALNPHQNLEPSMNYPRADTRVVNTDDATDRAAPSVFATAYINTD
jgi:hypothetical protein